MPNFGPILCVHKYTLVFFCFFFCLNFPFMLSFTILFPFQISPLDKAKVDLIGAYAVNSLFWSKSGSIYFLYVLPEPNIVQVLVTFRKLVVQISSLMLFKSVHFLARLCYFSSGLEQKSDWKIIQVLKFAYNAR